MVEGVDSPLELVSIVLVYMAAVQVLELCCAHRADKNPTVDGLLRVELGHMQHRLLLVLDHQILLVRGKR
jgi:hypothetical protein